MHSNSFDNTSLTNQLQTRLSNLSVDTNSKYLHKQLSEPNRRHYPLSSNSLSIPGRQTLSFSTSNQMSKLPIDAKRLSLIPSKQQSLSLSKLNQFKSPSEHSSKMSNIWIKHHSSDSTIEQLLNRELLDASV